MPRLRDPDAPTAAEHNRAARARRGGSVTLTVQAAADLAALRVTLGLATNAETVARALRTAVMPEDAPSSR